MSTTTRPTPGGYPDAGSGCNAEMTRPSVRAALANLIRHCAFPAADGCACACCGTLVADHEPGCALGDAVQALAGDDCPYLGALRTANETITRLESKLATALELVGNLSVMLDTGEHANHALRRNLRAAEGHVELIDNQALLLQDQAGELREAVGKAERFLDPKRAQPQSFGWYQREKAETLAALRRALAATAPEEGA